MTEYTRIHNQFEYHLEDCDCLYCLYRVSKSINKKGCSMESCCCSEIRAEAIAKGKIKREKGWFKINDYLN